MQMADLTAKLAADLSPLIEQAKSSPVFFREGDKEIAMLVSPEQFWEARKARAKQFESSRDALIEELSANLTKAGIRYVDFVNDVLR